MEERKQKEREFHNLLQKKHSEDRRSSDKFYSIVRRSDALMKSWVRARSENRWALDYGCGDGSYTILMAKGGAQAVGIDISDVSLQNAKKCAVQEGIDRRAQFLVMDCESLAFADNSFDIIVSRAILHHLDLDKALAELARVVKKEGAIICIEALADNPLIQMYRRITPNERTEWEIDHVLRAKDLKVAKTYFGKVDVKFFHLFTLAAVPFRNSRIFKALLSVLEIADSVALRLPFLKRMGWQMVFVLSEPNNALANPE